MLALPATARACTCALVGSPDRPASPPKSRTLRPSVFVGNALDIELPTDSTRSTRVRFVTEVSWRGEMPDTVTLVVSGSPCAEFVVGVRYLVAAERDDANGGRMRTGGCDLAVRLGTEYAVALLDTLGAPTWRAPPIGERSIAAEAVRLGTTVRRRAAPGDIRFSLPAAPGVRSFELGDARSSSGQSGPAVWLDPGRLYRYRITWDDGREYESVLRAECSPRSRGGNPCHLIFMVGFVVPAP